VIPWLAALSPALADDLFAVAPYGDGAVLATAWHERLELWFVDREGVRDHATFPGEDRLTNPAIGCGERACWVAWISFEGSVGTGRVSRLAPSRLDVLAPQDVGRATRVLVLPTARDARIAVESLPMKRIEDHARDAVWRTIDRRGAISPAQVFGGGQIAPATMQEDGDGVRYRAPGRREQWTHEAFGQQPTKADPLSLLPPPVCASGQPCDAGPRSAGYVIGRGGVRAWVMPDGAVHVGGKDWTTPVETISEARASWVARAHQAPATDPQNDGTEPFFVPTYVREVHEATLSLTFTGAVTGTTAARSGPAELAGARLQAPGDAPVGEVVALWKGRAGGLRPAVTAKLAPTGLEAPSACGALQSLDLGSSGLRLQFERGEEWFPVPAQLTLGDSAAQTTGAWSGRCVSGEQSITASWSVGSVIAATADEMGHFGMVTSQ
jgi:hypothetical protein